MPGARSHRRLYGALVIALAPSWAAGAELTASQAESLGAGESRWEAAGAVGPIRIVIDRSQQRAFVYRGDLLIGVSTVSTGKKGHATPLGSFTILQKAARHRSNKYSNAPMPFMQRLTWDGIALHAGPLPGFPASHGCIRLPWAFARKLFAETSLGVVVEVTDGEAPLPPVRMAAVDMPQLALVMPPTDDFAAVSSSSPMASSPALEPEPIILIAAPPRPIPVPTVLELAAPSPPARPPRATWLQQSADDYVTWGTLPPARGGSPRAR
jgi:hypothetical protein